jgi:hypothetical protein
LSVTTSVVDQGIIATFKAYYIRRTFQTILNKLDDNPSLTLTMVWKCLTILDCVKIVAAAKEEVRKSTLNGSWRNIWPSVVLEKNKALPPIEDEYQRIINLAHSVGGEGFEGMAIELSNRSWMKLIKSICSLMPIQMQMLMKMK